jgi:hypothetical protein
MTAVTIDQIFMAHGYSNPYSILVPILKDLDFLNIDLQGAELKALKGMGDRLNQFKWAYLEVNWEELYKGCALFTEVEAYLGDFGFRVAEFKKCGGTGWGDCLFIK